MIWTKYAFKFMGDSFSLVSLDCGLVKYVIRLNHQASASQLAAHLMVRLQHGCDASG